MNEQDTNMALLKVMVAWAGTMFGGITLSHLVLIATLIYTILQTYVLVRDRVLTHRKDDKP